MKPGAEDNPLDTDDDAGAERDRNPVTEQGTPAVEGSTSSDVPPYAMRRDGVKDGREMVPFWLQEESEDRLGDVKDEVEDILGYDVYLTDFKEAVVLEGLSNPEAVADRLDEWGCEYA